jgi:hypothetical protein
MGTYAEDKAAAAAEVIARHRQECPDDERTDEELQAVPYGASDQATRIMEHTATLEGAEIEAKQREEQHELHRDEWHRRLAATKKITPPEPKTREAGSKRSHHAANQAGAAKNPEG